MFKFMQEWHTLGKYPLVIDRFEIIEKHITGKNILDCGAGGGKIKPDEEWWHELFLHGRIKKVARDCTGIDIDSDAVNILNSMGYNIELGNVETMQLGRTFDVVVAGEIIEHVSNVGLFLDRVKDHLKQEGKFIFTTPNTNAIGNLIRSLFGKTTIIDPEHVAWYDLAVIDQLLHRHGFKIDEFYWHQHTTKGFYKIVHFMPSWAYDMIFVVSLSDPISRVEQ